MAYPIKYIENNLVFNHDGECFAYYELLPYNYSFLSPEQKYQVHDSFRQLIAQNRDGKIHALQISTESSIRAAQERSKQEVTGKLKDVACAKIDAQTEALISMIGENQVDYRFFIGFKLLVNEQEVTMKQFRREAKTAVSNFLHEVNHKLMGDFVSMSNEEIWRFQKMEKLLENKISRRFKVRRLNKDDFGYLIEHLYGQTGTTYEDYEYYLPKKRFQEETLVKYYDLIKPTRCLIEENQRYLKIEQEDGTVYAAYFTINSIVGELDFPSSEIFYYQQQQFTLLWSSFFVTLVAKKIVLINLCCRPCFIWGSITIITVWTNMIIINVCKFFYLLIECFLCCKLIQICAFILQGIEITLHRCIVVRISCFAHALCHIYRFAEFGKCFGRIL